MTPERLDECIAYLSDLLPDPDDYANGHLDGCQVAEGTQRGPCDCRSVELHVAAITDTLAALRAYREVMPVRVADRDAPLYQEVLVFDGEHWGLGCYMGQLTYSHSRYPVLGQCMATHWAPLPVIATAPQTAQDTIAKP